MPLYAINVEAIALRVNTEAITFVLITNLS